MNRLRLAILISGRGSNMQAILEAAADQTYPADPVLVLSNRPDALGLRFAAERGVATKTVDHTEYGKDREAFERDLQDSLTDAKVEMVVLAGFMRILTPWFVSRWQGRMINIHPSLLPKYPGLRTHQRAIEAGDSEAGCSVHWVTEGVDAGTVISQVRVPIAPGDTPETLAARILPAEHKLYPGAVKKAALEIMQRRQSEEY